MGKKRKAGGGSDTYASAATTTSSPGGRSGAQAAKTGGAAAANSAAAAADDTPPDAASPAPLSHGWSLPLALPDPESPDLGSRGGGNSSSAGIGSKRGGGSAAAEAVVAWGAADDSPSEEDDEGGGASDGADEAGVAAANGSLDAAAAAPAPSQKVGSKGASKGRGGGAKGAAAATAAGRGSGARQQSLRKRPAPSLPSPASAPPPPPRPRTVFQFSPSKVARIGGSSGGTGSASTAAQHSGEGLVVGLAAGERLTFVGGAAVRCTRGAAAVGGHVLLPQAMGAYTEVHSPKWQSALVVAALSEDDPLLTGCRLPDPAPPPPPGSAAEAREAALEGAADALSEECGTVLVFLPLPPSPTRFLSAAAEADALYAERLAAAAGTVDGDGSGEGGEGGGGPLAAAAALRLPGFQVVVDGVCADGVEALEVPPEWAAAVEAVVGGEGGSTAAAGGGGAGGAPAVLVCGARGAGKSTLCRYLANRLLSRHAAVAFMDCDVGQPELTPPGLVSAHVLRRPLLGPAHMHLQEPDVSFWLGAATSKAEPTLYSASVRALAEWRRGGAHAALPLVVNTDGWVKGMGHELLGAVVDVVAPSHVFQMRGATAARSPIVNSVPPGCRVHSLLSWRDAAAAGGAPPPAAPRTNTAADQRALRLMAYFLSEPRTAAATATSTTTTTGTATGTSAAAAAEALEAALSAVAVRGATAVDPGGAVAAALAAARPYAVPWHCGGGGGSGGGVRVRLMGDAGAAVPPPLAPLALNASIVGLVAAPCAAAAAASRSAAGPGGGGGQSGGGAAPPVLLSEDIIAPCVGLGIVRSVDPQRGLLYILTPVAPDRLRDVTVVAKGALHAPTEMVYDAPRCCHPYLSLEALAGGGGAAMRARAGLARRGLG